MDRYRAMCAELDEHPSADDLILMYFRAREWVDEPPRPPDDVDAIPDAGAGTEIEPDEHGFIL